MLELETNNSMVMILRLGALLGMKAMHGNQTIMVQIMGWIRVEM